MDEENKRIEIDDLTRAAEELTPEEAKDVTGGATPVPTGSVKFIVDGVAPSTTGNTIGGSLAGDPVDPSRKMGDGSV